MKADPRAVLRLRALACAIDATILILFVTVLARTLALAFPGAVPYLSWALFFTAWASYRIVGEGYYGATLGKILVNLRVVNARTGAAPGYLSALIRTLFRPVDGFPGLYLLGAVVAALSPSGERLGDRFAKTRVVRAVALPAWSGAPSADPKTEDTSPDRIKKRTSGEAHPAQTPSHDLDNEGRELLAARLKQLPQAGTWYVFDRNDLFLIVGPCGLVLLQPQYEPGELVVDEDGLRILLDSHPPAVDPLSRMRSHLLEADRLLENISPKHYRINLQDQLGPTGHHWYLCYTTADLHDRLSLGTLRPHVITLSDVPETMLERPSIFEDPLHIQQVAKEIAAAYEVLPIASPELRPLFADDQIAGASGSEAPDGQEIVS